MREMRRWVAGLVGLLALLLTTTLQACEARTANAADAPAEVTLTPLTVMASDSCAYALRWDPVSNSAGAADGYHVIVMRGSAQVRSAVVSTTTDTFAVVRPTFPDSVSVTASVAAVRRGVTYTATLANAYCSGADEPLPAPGNVRLDTVALAVHIRPQVAWLTVGDTVQLCAFVESADGYIQPDANTATIPTCDQYRANFPNYRAAAWRSTIPGPLLRYAMRQVQVRVVEATRS